MKLGGHYLVDMVCLLVSRKQKEKLREGWFRVVTFQQLCKHSGIYDSRFRGNRNLSSMWQKFMSSSKIVFLKHRFKQFPNSLMVNICRKIYLNNEVFNFTTTLNGKADFLWLWEFPIFNEDILLLLGFLKFFEGKNFEVYMGNDLENKTICIVPQFWQVIFSQLLKKVVNEPNHFPHHPKVVDSPKLPFLHWPPVALNKHPLRIKKFMNTIR